MLLVIDFSDLGLDADATDIRIYEGNEFTAETFLINVCKGLEEICHREIINSHLLVLLDPSGRAISPNKRISQLDLNDWDTLYITRRR